MKEKPFDFAKFIIAFGIFFGASYVFWSGQFSSALPRMPWSPDPNHPVCGAHEVKQGNPFNDEYECVSDCTENGVGWKRYSYNTSGGGGSFCAASEADAQKQIKDMFALQSTRKCPSDMQCIEILGGGGGNSFDGGAIGVGGISANSPSAKN